MQKLSFCGFIKAQFFGETFHVVTFDGTPPIFVVCKIPTMCYFAIPENVVPLHREKDKKKIKG